MVCAMSGLRDCGLHEPKEEAAGVVLSNSLAVVGVRVSSEVVDDHRNRAEDGQVPVWKRTKKLGGRSMKRSVRALCDLHLLMRGPSVCVCCTMPQRCVSRPGFLCSATSAALYNRCCRRSRVIQGTQSDWFSSTRTSKGPGMRRCGFRAVKKAPW